MFNIVLWKSLLLSLLAGSSLVGAQVFNWTCPSSGYKLCTAGTTYATVNATTATISNCVYDSCPQIYILNSNVTVYNVSFVNSVNPNSVTEGGAFRIYCQANNVVTLNKIYFNNNALGSGSFGGSIYITGMTNVPVVVNNITFNNGLADRGGGMFTRGANVAVSNIIGTNNQVGYHGSSIYFYQTTVSLNGIRLLNNQAPNGVAGDVYFYFCTSTITNYRADNGYATNGGSLYLNGGNFNFNGGYCNGASASGNGGCVYFVNGCTGTFQNFLFSGASAQYGGAYINFGNNINMTNVVFANCSTPNSGGGAYQSYTAISAFKNVTFNFNWATWGGDVATFDSYAILDNCKSYGSGSSGYGGSVFAQGTTVLTVTGGNYAYNYAGNYGGSFFASQSVVASFFNVAVMGGVSNYGGAIYVDASTFAFTYNGLSLTNNYAFSTGGALYFSNGNVTLTNSTFSGNQASSQGGDIYINKCLFTGSFLNSTGARAINGSSIYATVNSTVSVNDATITGAKANSAGSCFYQNGGFLSLTNVIVSNSNASYGAVYSNAAARNNFNWMQVISNVGNSTYFPSGGFYLDNSVSTMNQIYFFQNYAKDFYVNGGTFTCTYCNNLRLNAFCVYGKSPSAMVTLNFSTCDTVLRTTTTVPTTTTKTTAMIATTTSSANSIYQNVYLVLSILIFLGVLMN